MLYFHSALRKMRMEKGLSQAGLARELGIRSSMIENLEANYISPDPELFTKIIKYFDVPTDFFGSNEVRELSANTSALSIPLFSTGVFSNDQVTEADELGRRIIPVPPERDSEFFAIVAPDDSLDSQGIHRGNTLIIRAQSLAEDGSIVLVRLPDSGVALRKYYRNGDRITLSTGDRITPPVTFRISEPKFKVWGRAVSVIIDL